MCGLLHLTQTGQQLLNKENNSCSCLATLSRPRRPAYPTRGWAASGTAWLPVGNGQPACSNPCAWAGCTVSTQPLAKAFIELLWLNAQVELEVGTRGWEGTSGKKVICSHAFPTSLIKSKDKPQTSTQGTKISPLPPPPVRTGKQKIQSYAKWVSLPHSPTWSQDLVPELLQRSSNRVPCMEVFPLHPLSWGPTFRTSLLLTFGLQEPCGWLHTHLGSLGCPHRGFLFYLH